MLVRNLSSAPVSYRENGVVVTLEVGDTNLSRHCAELACAQHPGVVVKVRPVSADVSADAAAEEPAPEPAKPPKAPKAPKAPKPSKAKKAKDHAPTEAPIADAQSILTDEPPTE